MKKIIAVFILSVIFSLAFGSEDFGLLANKPSAPDNLVFVNIKNAHKDKKYKILRNGQLLTTLDVVSLVGEIGAVMKVNDTSSAEHIIKGDRVYPIEDQSFYQQLPKDSKASQNLTVTASDQNMIMITSNAPKKEETSTQPPEESTQVAMNTSSLPPYDPFTKKPEGVSTNSDVNAISSEPWDELILDEQDKGNLELTPASAWENSSNTDKSFKKKSLVMKCQGELKKATWKCGIPEDGTYNISLWWVASPDGVLANQASAVVYDADGEKAIKIDESSNSGKFVSIGDFKFKKGQNMPIISISNEGLQDSNYYISIDALKLTFKNQ